MAYKLTLSKNWPNGRFCRHNLQFAGGEPLVVERLTPRLQDELRNPGTGLTCEEIDERDVAPGTAAFRFVPDEPNPKTDADLIKGTWEPWEIERPCTPELTVVAEQDETVSDVDSPNDDDEETETEEDEETNADPLPEGWEEDLDDENLRQIAIELGVQGVRANWKRETLIDKIREQVAAAADEDDRNEDEDDEEGDGDQEPGSE